MALALYGCAAFAGGTATGLIQRIDQPARATPGSAPVMFLIMSVSISGTPPCNAAGRFVIDLSTTEGLEAGRLAQLLYALNRNARVSGTGLCDVYGGTETVLEVDGL